MFGAADVVHAKRCLYLLRQRHVPNLPPQFCGDRQVRCLLGVFWSCVFASRAAGRNKNEENGNSVDMRHSNVQANSGERQYFLSEGDETESNI